MCLTLWERVGQRSWPESWSESWLFGYWSCEAAHKAAHEAVPNGPYISYGLYIIISSLYSHRHQCLSMSIPPLSFIPHAWMHASYIHPVVQHACMGSTKHAEKCWSSYIICTYVFSPFSMDSIHIFLKYTYYIDTPVASLFLLSA
jgi:hypothetical protein